MTIHTAAVAAPRPDDTDAMRAALHGLLLSILTTATVAAGRMTEAGVLMRVYVRLIRGTWHVDVVEWVLVEGTSDSDSGS